MRILKRACFLYLERAKTIMAFVLLLPLLFIGLLFGNNFVASGGFFFSVFANSGDVFISFLIGAIFLFGFSVLSVVLMYSIKTYFMQVHTAGFKESKYLKYSLNVFYFYLLIYLGYIGLSYLIEGGLPDYLLSVYGLVVLLFIYVPQAIVLDNSRFIHSFFDSLDFVAKNFVYFLFTFFIGLGISLLGILLDFALLQVHYIFSYILAILLFGLGIPFFIVLNSYLYLLKHPLVRSKEDAQVYEF